MNTQSGTGPGVGALTALSNMQNRRLAANRAAEAAYAGSANPAPAARTGAPMGFTPEPVEMSMLPEYSGIPAGMEAQYSTSPAPPPVDAEFEAWLQTDQGRPYNFPDLPADFVRRAFERSKLLKAGKS
jgi:hypothetical protein